MKNVSMQNLHFLLIHPFSWRWWTIKKKSAPNKKSSISLDPIKNIVSQIWKKIWSKVFCLDFFFHGCEDGNFDFLRFLFFAIHFSIKYIINSVQAALEFDWVTNIFRSDSTMKKLVKLLFCSFNVTSCIYKWSIFLASCTFQMPVSKNLMNWGRVDKPLP